MQIKKKSDIESVLDEFASIADWDADGAKHYFVFGDKKRGGQWTLMKYDGGLYSVHGKGEDYSDEEEQFFEERGQVVSFLWEHRSAINAAVKKSA